MGILAIVAACGAPAKDPTLWRPQAAFHIDSADDVRWPVARTLFVGTVHRERAVTLLELDDDPAPSPTPPLIALRGIELPAGARVAVSGIGRAVAREESAAGAVITIDDVQREDITAPQVSGYRLLRHDSDLSIELARTYVTSEGVVLERDGQFVLQLPSGDPVPLWVTACDGEADARAHVHARRRVYGRLVAERGAMGIGAPTFE